MSYPKNAATPPALFASVVNATDGAPITSGVAAKYSTGAGSQAAGSGTCQHEGNGTWSYAPTQAETNVVAFGIQFYHADAVGDGPTISVVTGIPQTGDSYARLGAPTGASVSADIADIPTATENADELLKRDWSSVSGEAARSVLNALRFLRNKWSISSGTLTVTKENDSTEAWTAALTSTEGADPVTAVDPA